MGDVYACCPTQQQLLKLGKDWIISLTSCMPRELLSTGTLERVWKRENSLKLGKIWQLWRRITKRLELIPWKEREMKKVANTKLNLPSHWTKYTLHDMSSCSLYY